ncbi:MAG: MoxR family ATPase [Verrucomicrobia bacterium]|jgi:MoxR-like ATPase|nr:MoxR family ATPase [Verrucomicrobiota bacterium]MBT7065256.1 MoxR family ATPase [Verrucomicrobiota bacterium]MBT7701714.1 MoxR family ATPase [Verrucomicrobiota bacterium]
MTTETNDVKAVEKLGVARQQMLDELKKNIVGMEEVIDQVIIAIFSRGHCLLEGVPGLAKTLLISTIAESLSLSFNRIQFTPDLMPADITGTEMLQDNPETGKREFIFSAGPVFTNILLADEINRTPPKTQAALLEAMQEKTVTARGEDYKLDLPFFVLATQNPLDQEGTYSLPEAQLDRFMFKVHVDYPSFDEEVNIVHAVTGRTAEKIVPVLGKEDILALQDLVKRVPVADHLVKYVTTLVRATRPAEEDAPDFIKDWISWGCGPRACINLVTAAKARAVLNGRFNVALDDIKALALPVLRHRLGLNFAAMSDGISTDEVIKRLLETVPSDTELADK